jgi:hypothetical protein
MMKFHSTKHHFSVQILTTCGIVHVHSQLALSKNFCLNRGWHLTHKVPQNLMHKVPPLLSDDPQLSAYKTKKFHWFLIWHKERPQMGLFWEFRSHTQLLPHMGSSFSEQPCSLAPYPTLKNKSCRIIPSRITAGHLIAGAS